MPQVEPNAEALAFINSPFIASTPEEMRTVDAECMEMKAKGLRENAAALFTEEDILAIEKATVAVVATFRKELEAIGGQYGKGLEMLNLLHTMLSMGCSPQGKMLMGTTLIKGLTMLEQMGAVEVMMEKVMGKPMREIDEFARQHGLTGARPAPTKDTH
jgi:hypothetical protein